MWQHSNLIGLQQRPEIDYLRQGERIPELCFWLLLRLRRLGKQPESSYHDVWSLSGLVQSPELLIYHNPFYQKRVIGYLPRPLKIEGALTGSGSLSTQQSLLEGIVPRSLVRTSEAWECLERVQSAFYPQSPFGRPSPNVSYLAHLSLRGVWKDPELTDQAILRWIGFLQTAEVPFPACFILKLHKFIYPGTTTRLVNSIREWGPSI